jgi:hypothetical protein
MGRVSDAIAATRDGTLDALIDERRNRTTTSEKRDALTVAQAMDAAKDGTFEEKTRATAAARAATQKADPKSLQRGKDLYDQFTKEGK